MDQMRDINRIKNLIIRMFKGNLYYFNEEGIYCKLKSENVKKGDFKNVIFREDGSFFIDDSELRDYFDSIRIVKKAISKVEIGQRIEEFEALVKNTKIAEPTYNKYKGIERFITRIENPIFMRYPENLNKNTFDFIYVNICIISEWKEDKKEYIRKHIKEIESKVLNKIESCKEYKKFGVPLNFLRITRVTLRKDDVIQFVFELKDI